MSYSQTKRFSSSRDSYGESDDDSSILSTSSSSRHHHSEPADGEEDIRRSYRHDIQSDSLMEEANESGSNVTPSPYHMYPDKSTTQDLMLPNRFSNTWLDPNKLAADLEKIIPNFSFRNSAVFSSMFDDIAQSESSEASSISDQDDALSYTSSCHWTPRHPRQSWSGNLDTSIIDATDMLDVISRDSDNDPLYSTDSAKPKRRRVKRRRDSFDWSFRRVRPTPSPAPSAKSLLIDNANVIEFESKPCPYDQLRKKVPLFQLLLREKSISTTLILDRKFLTIKFTSQMDYLCSSFKIQKQKLVLPLLDIINILVIKNTNTLIIQYKDIGGRRMKKKDKMNVYKISDTIKLSRSISLNRSSASGCNTLSNSSSDIIDIEVGQYNNAEQLASLILKRKDSLLPKPILKRGSMKREKMKPQVVSLPTDTISLNSSEQDFPVESMVEFLSYV